MANNLRTANVLAFRLARMPPMGWSTSSPSSYAADPPDGNAACHNGGRLSSRDRDPLGRGMGKPSRERKARQETLLSPKEV